MNQRVGRRLTVPVSHTQQHNDHTPNTPTPHSLSCIAGVSHTTAHDHTSNTPTPHSLSLLHRRCLTHNSTMTTHPTHLPRTLSPASLVPHTQQHMTTHPTHLPRTLFLSCITGPTCSGSCSARSSPPLPLPPSCVTTTLQQQLARRWHCPSALLRHAHLCPLR